MSMFEYFRTIRQASDRETGLGVRVGEGSAGLR